MIANITFIRAGILIGILLGLILSSQAQIREQVEQDLNRIHQVYNELESFSTEIDQKLYPSPVSQRFVHQVKGEMMLSGLNMYSMIDGIETLKNKEVQVVANHQNKTVMVQKNHFLDTLLWSPMPIENILDQCTAIKEVEGKNGQRVYDFFFAEMKYERLRLAFDPQTALIKSITLYLQAAEEWTEGGTPTKGRLEIHFRNSRINPQLAKHTFSADRFYQLEAGKPSLQSAYKQFQLFNYLPAS